MKSSKHKKSIGFKLVSGIVALSVLLLLILGGTIYIRMKKQNEQQFNGAVNSTIAMLDSSITMYLKSIQNAVNLFSDVELVRTNDESITSYVDLTGPGGKVPMKPLEASPYEADVYKLARSLATTTPELTGVGLALESNGAFVRYPEEPRSDHYDSRVRSWYKNAVKDNGAVHFSDAYTTSAGEMVIAVSKIVKGLDNRMRGVVTLDADLTNLNSLCLDILKQGSAGMKVLLVDSTGAILINNMDDALSFKKVQEIGIKSLEGYTPGVTASYREKVSGQYCTLRTVPSSNGILTLNYIIIIPESLVYASNRQIIQILGVLLVVGIVLSMLMAGFMTRVIAKPLSNVTSILKNISEGDGDLTQRLPILSNDEIGELSGYFNETMQKLADTIKSIISESSVMEHVAKTLAGDTTDTASAANEIRANISSIKNQILNQSSSVSHTSEVMEHMTDSINKLNENIAVQASNVVQSSASIEEMVANIRSVNSILEKNAHSVEELTSSADAGRTLIEKTVEVTKNISADSEGLLEATKIIQNIASQTNLLAMNAAIEAAHAGESGRGFAVVADEIRKLAEDSNTQGKRISEELDRLRTLIVSVSSGAQEIQKQFDVIFNNTQTVSGQETVIKNAMTEQAAGGQQVIDAIHRINTITTEVKDGAEEMMKGSADVKNAMNNLSTVTTEITNSMGEMTEGVNDITNALQNIKQSSDENANSIQNVGTAIRKFKV
ncbi:MAG: HAMP domain-containing protein [Treponema sp.]|nr:HAMP domain-containing protein [Treponema sp.]